MLARVPTEMEQSALPDEVDLGWLYVYFRQVWTMTEFIEE
jgi:hypothetical protein